MRRSRAFVLILSIASAGVFAPPATAVQQPVQATCGLIGNVFFRPALDPTQPDPLPRTITAQGFGGFDSAACPFGSVTFRGDLANQPLDCSFIDGLETFVIRIRVQFTGDHSQSTLITQVRMDPSRNNPYMEWTGRVTASSDHYAGDHFHQYVAVTPTDACRHKKLLDNVGFPLSDQHEKPLQFRGANT